MYATKKGENKTQRKKDKDIFEKSSLPMPIGKNNSKGNTKSVPGWDKTLSLLEKKQIYKWSTQWPPFYDKLYTLLFTIDITLGWPALLSSLSFPADTPFPVSAFPQDLVMGTIFSR